MDTLLPSWNDGATKDAIVDFIARVTNVRGPDFVPPSKRIATFDNDGTLWCEQPLPVQGFFLSDRVKELTGVDPSLKERQPFKALIEQDHVTLHLLGKRGLETLFAATHTGMTLEEFNAISERWLASAKHPKLERLFTSAVYKPQLELLSYLRNNGFKTFIVTGGGIEFVRAFAEATYGIPREQIIGSNSKLHFEMQGTLAVVVKDGNLNSFDDRDAKPANIALHIGRRPILAFGNSDGDLAMLRYCRTGPGPRLALLLHHDDEAREFSYDRDFKISPLTDALDKAIDYGLTVVSMKQDWREVFDAERDASVSGYANAGVGR